MTKKFTLIFCSFFLFSIFLISWTNPSEDELSFPIKLHDYKFEFPKSVKPQYTYQINNEIANLGRVLFYDKLLSTDESTSCASCHKQEFSFGDNVALSEGINGTLTKRNSINLNDIGWQRNKGFFWDFQSQTLDEAVLLPILNPDELGLEFSELIQKLEVTDYYPPLFEYAFNEKEISSDKIAIALSEFIKSMVTFESYFDNDLNLSSMGSQIFHRDCNVCHKKPHSGGGFRRSPYDFTSGQFKQILNNGLDSVYSDLGYGEWADNDDIILFSNHGVFKTPTLRNLSYTAPYMHDGRFKTLEEVIDFYSTGIQMGENTFGNNYYGGIEQDTLTGERGFFYTSTEKEALLLFLKSLDDSTLITHPKWADPFLEEPDNFDFPIIHFDFKVGPNPVETYTQIYISNSLLESYDLFLYNASGKLVRQISTESGTYRLQREDLPSGIYFLQVKTEHYTQSKKLLFL